MSTPLTDEQLAAIKERADKATPGPWAREYLDVHTAGIRIADFETLGDNADDWRQMEADADFSAHARQDVPALLAEVKRLKTRLAAAEMACLAFGAMGGRMETDREKAAYELWWEWTQLEPRLDSGSTGPLTDDLIEELARRRDAKRDTVTQFLAELGGETS